jgi:hypothetical protein
MEGETGQRQRMTRHRDERPEQRPLEQVPVGHERLQQALVRRSVLPQPGGRLLDRSLDNDGRPVVERMREHRRRVDEVEPELERAEEGRAYDEGVDPRAEVVHEARQSELGRTRAAADRLLCFAYQHRAPCEGERDRRAEPVRAGPDDDGVVRSH